MTVETQTPPSSTHHIGPVRVEGSILHVLPSPGQEEISFDLREHDVPILDAWPWTTNAILLTGLAIVVGLGAWLLGSPWAWGGGALIALLLLRSAAANMHATPVIRLFRDGVASEVRLDPIGDEDFQRLAGELSFVHGAIGFASSSLPGVPAGEPLDGLLYILTHDKASQSLHVMKLCYRQAVAQMRAGELSHCDSIQFLVNGTVPETPERRESFEAALRECEDWSETTGPRVQAEYSWVHDA